jgi:chromosome segregation ATPase
LRIMFIQEIIIDGFKSYAHRTVVQGYVRQW